MGTIFIDHFGPIDLTTKGYKHILQLIIFLDLRGYAPLKLQLPVK